MQRLAKPYNLYGLSGFDSHTFRQWLGSSMVRAPACHAGSCGFESRPSRQYYTKGSVAEWLKALVLKTSDRESVPWVRIPPLPPVEN
jgi:hypothetical protein